MLRHPPCYQNSSHSGFRHSTPRCRRRRRRRRVPQLQRSFSTRPPPQRRRCDKMPLLSLRDTHRIILIFILDNPVTRVPKAPVHRDRAPRAPSRAIRSVCILHPSGPCHQKRQRLHLPTFLAEGFRSRAPQWPSSDRLHARVCCDAHYERHALHQGVSQGLTRAHPCLHHGRAPIRLKFAFAQVATHDFCWRVDSVTSAACSWTQITDSNKKYTTSRPRVRRVQVQTTGTHPWLRGLNFRWSRLCRSSSCRLTALTRQQNSGEAPKFLPSLSKTVDGLRVCLMHPNLWQ